MPVSFSDAEGLYITDTLVDDGTKSQSDSLADSPKVITLCEEPYWASVTNEAVVQKIKQLEVFIAEDSGEQNLHTSRFFIIIIFSYEGRPSQDQ